MCRKPKYTPKTVRFEKTNKLKHKFVKKQISKSQIPNYKNKYQLNKIYKYQKSKSEFWITNMNLKDKLHKHKY